MQAQLSVNLGDLPDVGRCAVIGVDDGKVERVRRGPAECELQGEMQGVEFAIGGAGERSNDRRVGYLSGVEMELDDIVGTSTVVLVRGPCGCLAAFGAVRHATASCTPLQSKGRIDGIVRLKRAGWDRRDFRIVG
ncbi:hypothetical protein VP1G_01155 [Cytospora mali]|uniref:Uncharacterized protein n=1 Tax=Cytospora mali TaxID=578113 RepID=A0A194UQB9_CYTMA|nr:hypothetical protein VP1G_01155 [Valsa mali var. pyri (nom. inval.)]